MLYPRIVICIYIYFESIKVQDDGFSDDDDDGFSLAALNVINENDNRKKYTFSEKEFRSCKGRIIEIFDKEYFRLRIYQVII